MQPLVGAAFEASLAPAHPRHHDVSDARAAAPPMRIEVVAGKGRGLFATRDIKEGELVEVAPVIVVPADEVERIYGSVLELYVFDWYADASAFAIALGNASLYNHSYRPNVRYDKRFDDALIEFRALRDIRAGEELVSNYNGDPNDRSPVWFPTVDEGDER